MHILRVVIFASHAHCGNQRCCHLWAVSLWNRMSYTSQGTSRTAQSTLTLEVSPTFRIICFCDWQIFSSSFRERNTMFRTLSITCTLLDFVDFATQHTLVRWSFNTSDYGMGAGGKTGLLAEGTKLQLMLWSGCTGQKPHSFTSFILQ